MNEKHCIDKDKKLKFLGEGPWVDESDIVEFTYKDYECLISRVFVKYSECLISRVFVEEPYAKEEAYFGGHLCGYVRIPEGHNYFGKDYGDMDISCHGGITFSDESKIGFDCTHAWDIVPSMGKLRKDNGLIDRFPLPDEFKCYQNTYRNIEFCVKECESIVDQLILLNSTGNLINEFQ